MPFDFYEMNAYTVNYEDLQTTLLSFGALLSSRTLQVQFMNDWIKQLNRLDAAIVRRMNSPRAKQDYLRNKLNEPEVYQVPVFLGSNTFQLLFRISPLLQMLSSTPDVKPTKLLASTFTADATVHWDRLNTMGKTPPQIPIILVPFPIGTHRYLVIDGNHRLSVNISKHTDVISAYILAGRTLIDSHLLSCEFDRYLYAMILEFQSCKLLFDAGASDADILSQSMLRRKIGQFSFSI